MHIHPWWHSGTHSCPGSSPLHNFFPSGIVGPASSLDDTVGPASSLVPPYKGTVGPTSVKLPYMQIQPW